MPLPGNGGGVTGGLELMSEGPLLTIQPPELHVVSNIVLPSHKFHTRRCTDGIGKTVGEADTCRGKFVEVWRLAGLAAVGRQGFVAHIVRHDQDDIRLSGNLTSPYRGKCNNDQSNPVFHYLEKRKIGEKRPANNADMSGLFEMKTTPRPAT